MQNPKALIDWLDYSLPVDTAPPRHLWEGGPEIAWVAQPSKARYGYQLVHNWQSVELWTVHHNAGPHVSMSGKACADLARAALTDNPDWTWQGHFKWLDGQGARCSRVDVAVDVPGGPSGLDLDAIALAVDEGRVVTRWDAWEQMKGLGKRGKGGNTIYGGSKDSDTRLCAYDKKAERGLPDDAPDWTRVEFRAKHEPAISMARALARGGMAAAMSIIMGYARFTTPEGDTLPAWADALNFAGAQALDVKKRGGTYESMVTWLDAGVAASLAALVDANGGDWGAVERLVHEGRKRYSPRQRSLINERQRELTDRGLTGGV